MVSEISEGLTPLSRSKLRQIDEQKAARDRELPDLKACWNAVCVEKQSLAEQIAAFGSDSLNEANPDRLQLIDRLRTLNLELNDLNAAMSVHGNTADGDMRAHVEDLQRRVGAAGG